MKENQKLQNKLYKLIDYMISLEMNNKISIKELNKAMDVAGITGAEISPD